MAWHHHIASAQRSWTSKHPWMTFFLAATGIGAIANLAARATSTTPAAPAAPSAAPGTPTTPATGA